MVKAKDRQSGRLRGRARTGRERSPGHAIWSAVLAALVVVATVLAGTQLVSVSPAAAASAPVITPGVLGYLPSSNPESPGSTTAPVPNQIKVTTLVTGGSASVNTSSLTIVTQSTSGSAAANTTSDVVTWTPTTATTGIQTVTFAMCAPSVSYSVGNPLCTDSTLTFNPATVQPMGENVNAPIAGVTPVVANFAVAVVGPTSAPQGSTVTISDAPVPTAVPTSLDGGLATVNNASGFATMIPIPTGLSYVAGSITTTGGDATTAGELTAVVCTTASHPSPCSAQMTGNYKTTFPYIEAVLNPSTTIAGGSNDLPADVHRDLHRYRRRRYGAVGVPDRVPAVDEFHDPRYVVQPDLRRLSDHLRPLGWNAGQSTPLRRTDGARVGDRHGRVAVTDHHADIDHPDGGHGRGSLLYPTATASSGLTVSLSLDATSTGCSLSGGVVSFVATGTCVVDFNQSGNASYLAAPQVQQSFAVSQGTQSVTITSTPPTATVGGVTYTPTATASSGLAVAVTLDGSSTGRSLAGGVVSFTAVGTCVIDFNQSGNANYTAAPQKQQSVAVGQGAQSITFTSTAPAPPSVVLPTR